MFYWSQIPFVRISIPFILGIIFQSYLQINYPINYLLCGFSIFLLAQVYLVFRSNYQLRYAFGILLPLVLFLFGALFFKQYNQRTELNTLDVGKEILWEGKVIALNNPNAKNPQFICQVKNIIRGDSALESKNLKTLAYFKIQKQNLEVGDLFWGSSKFQIINENTIPNQFDYSSLLARRQIYYQTFISEYNLVGQHRSLMSLASEYRNKLIDVYQKVGFTGDRLGVLVALTLGNKSYLNRDIKSSFAQAGAMHILAVSGLHVGIVFMIFNTLFKVFPNKSFFSFLKAVILLFVIWSFALLTGFAPSVQRAACMFSIIILATALNRSSNILNSIFGSAFILLLINLNSIFEVGFQLSYSAVLGIVLIYPVIYPMLVTKHKILNWFTGVILVSISAQLATLPFTLYYFHQFPNWFLLINIIVIPLAFVLVGLSILLHILYAIFSETLGINWLMGLLIDGLNHSVTSVELLPYSYTSGIWINMISAIAICLLVISLTYWLHYPRSRGIISILFLLSVIVSIEIVEEKRQSNQDFIGVYSNSKSNLISIVHGKKAKLIQVSQHLFSFDREMAINHLKSKGVEEIITYNSLNDFESFIANDQENVHFMQWGNSLIAVLSDGFSQKEILKFSEIDYLICLEHSNLFNNIEEIQTNSKLIIRSEPYSNIHEKRFEKTQNLVMLKNSSYYQLEI